MSSNVELWEPYISALPGICDRFFYVVSLPILQNRLPGVTRAKTANFQHSGKTDVGIFLARQHINCDAGLACVTLFSGPLQFQVCAVCASIDYPLQNSMWWIIVFQLFDAVQWSAKVFPQWAFVTFSGRTSVKYCVLPEIILFVVWKVWLMLCYFRKGPFVWDISIRVYL